MTFRVLQLLGMTVPHWLLFFLCSTMHSPLMNLELVLNLLFLPKDIIIDRSGRWNQIEHKWDYLFFSVAPSVPFLSFVNELLSGRTPQT